jgi:predicted metallopeptidase
MAAPGVSVPARFGGRRGTCNRRYVMTALAGRAPAMLHAATEGSVPQSGHDSGFDFSLHMRRLCADMVERLPELAHIDLERVAIGFCQARKRAAHGIWATLTPLRFEGGATHAVRGGRLWRMPQLRDDAGREFLYLLRFYLPRFLQLPFDEKLTTVVHELWHINPAFDGDLRRHPGRCFAHGSSKGQYDRQMEALAARWLAAGPPPELHEFLQLTFGRLQARYGPVFGLKIRPPRLIEVRSVAATDRLGAPQPVAQPGRGKKSPRRRA